MTIELRNFILGFSMALILCFFSGMKVVHAASWTTVGATGTINNDDLNLYEIGPSTGLLTFAPNATGVFTVKYNVVPINGFNASLFRIRFRDNGAAARVVAQLKRYNLSTGVTSTVVSYDSDIHAAPQNSWQTDVVCFGHNFDVNQYAYFINAELTRSSSTGNTGLGAIQISSSNCVP